LGYNTSKGVVGTLGHCATPAVTGDIIGGDCVDSPSNVIRYDSPTFAGFSMSADWGQDDYWDVYGRYAGEWNGFKLAATTGWSDNSRGGPGVPTSTCSLPLSPTNGSGCEVGYWQSGVYVEHVATGLFIYGAYGQEFLSNVDAGFSSNPDHWMVKGGIRQHWNALGHTVLYGSFDQRTDMLDAATVSKYVGNEINHSELNEWSLGVVQEVDAAAMSLWLQYDNFSGSVSAFDNTKYDIKDSQVLKFGGLINF
jgi:hypothetical protein